MAESVIDVNNIKLCIQCGLGRENNRRLSKIIYNKDGDNNIQEIIEKLYGIKLENAYACTSCIKCIINLHNKLTVLQEKFHRFVRSAIVGVLSPSKIPCRVANHTVSVSDKKIKQSPEQIFHSKRAIQTPSPTKLPTARGMRPNMQSPTVTHCAKKPRRNLFDSGVLQ